MNLFIFSDDLRTQDNKALYEASLDQNGLVALFIIDKEKNKDHGDSLAKLKLKLCVSSVSAFFKFCAKLNDIGPIGDAQFRPIPVEDLILLLSSIESE